MLISKIRTFKYLLRHCEIPFTAEIKSGVDMINCKIGKYCYIQRNCDLNCTVVGNYSSIASDVHIGGMEHSYWMSSISTWLSNHGVSNKITHIGHGVWIAAGSIIRQGVTIGNGAVVGANSYVNKDVPPFAIVAGSPAKVIKYRFPENIQKRIEDTEYWKYKPKEAKSKLADIDAELGKGDFF